MATVSATMTVRTTQEIKERLNTLAKTTGRNISWYVNKALSEELENLEDIYIKMRPFVNTLFQAV